MKPSFSAFATVLILTGASPAEQLPSVAVSDFEARGIQAHEAAIIAERFRGELVESGLFKVMERGQMEAVLEEQGFQQSGVCADATCVMEIGQLLSVSKMVVGSVGRIGEMFTLNVKLVDISSGEILLSLDEHVRGAVEDVFLTAVPSMSRKLIAEASAMKVMVGYLNVNSEPAGATVSVDQKPVGTTPLSQIEVEAGQRKVAVSLEDHAAQERTVTVAKKATVDLEFTLSPTEELLKKKREQEKRRRQRLKSVLRWTSVGVAAVGLGASGWYHLQWSKNDADYRASTVPSEAELLHRNIEQLQTYRSLSLILGGAGLVGLGVTFVF
jgi:TolB-like protein